MIKLEDLVTVAHLKYYGHKFDIVDILEDLNYDRNVVLVEMNKLRLHGRTYRNVSSLTIKNILLHYGYVMFIFWVLTVVNMDKCYIIIFS